MRLIDADAIKIPCKRDDIYYRNTYSSGVTAMVHAIGNTPTIEQYGTWIPCTQELPKVEGSYMTTTEYGAVRVNHFYTRNNTWGYKSNKTIAWMPLPEPYREEKKDE